MDALYFRVSSDRQTVENQFFDVLSASTIAPKDKTRINDLLSTAVTAEPRPTAKDPGRTLYQVDDTIAAYLSAECVYLEQSKSAKVGSASRPLFEQMKRDAAMKRFDRLLVWKVSRLGRDMREVLNTVYELADLGVTVVPVKSNTGPITSSMGKLLWAVMAWFSEMENTERREQINAGLERARRDGKNLGRPKRIWDHDKALEMRRAGHGILSIARQLKIPETTVRRLIQQKMPDTL